MKKKLLLSLIFIILLLTSCGQEEPAGIDNPANGANIIFYNGNVLTMEDDQVLFLGFIHSPLI